MGNTSGAEARLPEQPSTHTKAAPASKATPSSKPSSQPRPQPPSQLKYFSIPTSSSVESNTAQVKFSGPNGIVTEWINVSNVGLRDSADRNKPIRSDSVEEGKDPLTEEGSLDNVKTTMGNGYCKVPGQSEATQKNTRPGPSIPSSTIPLTTEQPRTADGNDPLGGLPCESDVKRRLKEAMAAADLEFLEKKKTVKADGKGDAPRQPPKPEPMSVPEVKQKTQQEVPVAKTTVPTMPKFQQKPQPQPRPTEVKPKVQQEAPVAKAASATTPNVQQKPQPQQIGVKPVMRQEAPTVKATTTATLNSQPKLQSQSVEAKLKIQPEVPVTSTTVPTTIPPPQRKPQPEPAFVEAKLTRQPAAPVTTASSTVLPQPQPAKMKPTAQQKAPVTGKNSPPLKPNSSAPSTCASAAQQPVKTNGNGNGEKASTSKEPSGGTQNTPESAGNNGLPPGTNGTSNSISNPPKNSLPLSSAKRRKKRNVKSSTVVDDFFYEDKQGGERGPYPERQMQYWYRGGHFCSEDFIRIRQEWFTLGELLDLNGNQCPFRYPTMVEEEDEEEERNEKPTQNQAASVEETKKLSDRVRALELENVKLSERLCSTEKQLEQLVRAQVHKVTKYSQTYNRYTYGRPADDAASNSSSNSVPKAPATKPTGASGVPPGPASTSRTFTNTKIRLVEPPSYPFLRLQAPISALPNDKIVGFDEVKKLCRAYDKCDKSRLVRSLAHVFQKPYYCYLCNCKLATVSQFLPHVTTAAHYDKLRQAGGDVTEYDISWWMSEIERSENGRSSSVEYTAAGSSTSK